jgi:hypothetical protein
MRVLEEKLRDAQFQIDKLKQKNKEPEDQLRMQESEKDVCKRDMVTVKTGVEKWLVLGDSIVRNVGAERSNMRVECFPGIRSDQLRRVLSIGTLRRETLGTLKLSSSI